MRLLISGLLAGAIAFALLPATAQAVELELVSRTGIASVVDSDGDSSNGFSASADGRFLLYYSQASNLVPGDSNGIGDLFVYDQVRGTSQRINVSSQGAQADAESLSLGRVSNDGRFVVFTSRATNLTADAVTGNWQVYLRDRESGTTTLVSRDKDGQVASADAYGGQISADGRYIIFETADSLLDADTNDRPDIYRVERASGTLELVSADANGQSDPEYGSGPATLSPDGRFVLFRSDSSTLLPGDTPFTTDLLIRDMDTGAYEAANVSPTGTRLAGRHELIVGNAFSTDNRYVLFNTRAALETGDTNNATDGYRYDRVSHIAQRVTRGALTPQLAGGARALGLSDDGNSVLMDSSAAVVAGVPAGRLRNYLHNVGSGEVSLVKLQPGPLQPGEEVAGCVLSGDTATVYCESRDFGTDHNEYFDIYRSSVGSFTGQRVSQPHSNDPVIAGNGHSRPGAISADSRYVVFQSDANNLVPGDNNGVRDVFLRDRLGGTTTRLSVGAGGAESACASDAAEITPDGSAVFFHSCGALLPTANGSTQVYRYERDSGRLQLVSRTEAGEPCNADCRLLAASADGRSVAFVSSATNLVADALPAAGGLFVRAVDAGAPALVNRALQGVADCRVSKARLSGDGQKVFFSDCSGNLVDGDSNFAKDVFVYQRAGGSLQRLSVDNSGQQLDYGAELHGVSQDGSLLLLGSLGFLCNESTGFQLRDLASGQSRCISDDSLTEGGTWADLSADGNRAVFTALDRSVALWGQVENVFAYDRPSHRVWRVTAATSSGHSQQVRMCPGGDCVLFGSRAGNLVPSDPNGGLSDVFLATDLFADRIFDDGFEP